MIDLKRLYNEIENPLTDEVLFNILKQINKKAGYQAIIKYYSDNEKYDINKDLIVYLFKLVKKVQTQTSQDKDLIREFNRLEQIITIDTIQRILSTNEYPNIKEVLQNILAFDLMGYWTHVISSQFIPNQNDKIGEIKHRLYLNPGKVGIELFGYLFIKKCLEKNLSFYFKNPSNIHSRDDNFVIYTDIEHLGQFIELLRELKEENPQIINKMGKPTVLSGVIDGWIGIGSEPGIRYQSFNSVRADLIFSPRIINKATRRWVYSNQESKVIYENKEVNILDYIAIKCVDNILQKYKEEVKTKIRELNNQEKIKEVLNQYQQTRKKYFKMIREKIPGIINEGKSFHIYNLSEISTYKDFKVNNHIINDIILNLITRSEKPVPSFIKLFREELNIEMQYTGIDPEKFCFDKVRVRELFEYQDRLNQERSRRR